MICLCYKLELTDLLRLLQNINFWKQQLLMAQNEGFSKTLRPHRLIRLLPVRNWGNKNTPWPLRIDPRHGYSMPEAMIRFLPIQLCVWITAQIKVLVPDPDSLEDPPLPPVPFQHDRTFSVLQVFTNFQDVKARKRLAETQLRKKIKFRMDLKKFNVVLTIAVQFSQRP